MLQCSPLILHPSKIQTHNLHQPRPPGGILPGLPPLDLQVTSQSVCSQTQEGHITNCHLQVDTISSSFKELLGTVSFACSQGPGKKGLCAYWPLNMAISHKPLQHPLSGFTGAVTPCILQAGPRERLGPMYHRGEAKLQKGSTGPEAHTQEKQGCHECLVPRFHKLKY